MEARTQPEVQPSPGPDTGGPPAPAIRSSAANDLMFEDCLKSILLKAKTGKTYCPYKNKFCPKPMQSPFGDFPAEFLPANRPMGVSSSFEGGNMSATMHSMIVSS